MRGMSQKGHTVDMQRTLVKVFGGEFSVKDFIRSRGYPEYRYTCPHGESWYQRIQARGLLPSKGCEVCKGQSELRRKSKAATSIRTDATRGKLSAAQVKRYNDPDERAKTSSSWKSVWRRSGYKKEMAQKSRGYSESILRHGSLDPLHPSHFIDSSVVLLSFISDGTIVYKVGKSNDVNQRYKKCVIHERIDVSEYEAYRIEKQILTTLREHGDVGVRHTGTTLKNGWTECFIDLSLYALARRLINEYR